MISYAQTAGVNSLDRLDIESYFQVRRTGQSLPVAMGVTGEKPPGEKLG